MSNKILLKINPDQFREVFIKYTRKAFQLLPELDKPRILDIGCGSGVPTIELAKLSNGEIIGIDIDQAQLDKLNRKIKQKGFSDRMKTKKCSLFKIDFPDENFDIIWAEGLVFISFEKKLKEWKRLLRTNGFLVMHDDSKNISYKLKTIPSCGYKLINHFSLPEKAWWTEYYCPLEIQVKKIQNKFKNDPKTLKILRKYQKEIDMVKKNPKGFDSVFYIIQKL